MKFTIGLDIGGSTTKVVGFEGRRLLGVCLVRASDPLASAYGGIGKFLRENSLELPDVKEIVMTGVGSSYLENGEILGIPTRRTDEFQAVGLGGLFLSGLPSAVVVSMGTGTSLVAAREGEIRHIIGSGVGGGSLLGLSHAMINVSDFEMLSAMAEKGDLSRVDLSVGEISALHIPGLSGQTTASNFGKVGDDAQKEDLAKGIVNLVFQSVGTASVLAARMEAIRDIVFVGSLLRVAEGRRCLEAFSQLYDICVHIPEQAEYCTAIGAALSGRH